MNDTDAVLLGLLAQSAVSRHAGSSSDGVGDMIATAPLTFPSDVLPAAWVVREGDCLALLRALPDACVDCVVTSPPYWGLRSYLEDHDPLKAYEIGSEPTLEEYVAGQVRVWHEVYRVLKPSGVVFANYGDTYSNAGRSNQTNTGGRSNGNGGKAHYTPNGGLGEKQLQLVPFRVAMAMQEDGWVLRQWHPWLKRNPLPSSAGDRAGVAVEVFFQFSKQPRYWFDMESIRRAPIVPPFTARQDGARASKFNAAGDGDGQRYAVRYNNPSGRAWRNTDPWFDSLDVLIEQERALLAHLSDIRERGGMLVDGDELLALDICPQPLAEAHFAAFGPRLVEPLIRAGCPEQVCGTCGAPWVRQVERAVIKPIMSGDVIKGRAAHWRRSAHTGADDNADYEPPRTIGWRPTCAHDAPTLPGLVLDPFSGAGTTVMVARRLGRRGLGFELSPAYCGMARDRILADAPMFNAPVPDDAPIARQLGMFEEATS